MSNNESDIKLEWNDHQEKWTIKVPPNTIWWDDGLLGGGDWIATQPVDEDDLDKLLAFCDDTAIEDDFEAMLPRNKALQWLKDHLGPNDHWSETADYSLLQAKYGRRPCPECGALLEGVEPDQTSPYCYECEKNVTVESII